MAPRLNFFKFGPEAMKTEAGLDLQIARSSLEKSLVERVPAIGSPLPFASCRSEV
jgi:hypothetical protein